MIHHEAGWLSLDDVDGRELRVRAEAVNYMLWYPEAEYTEVELAMGCGHGSSLHTFEVKQTPAEIIDRLAVIRGDYEEQQRKYHDRLDLPPLSMSIDDGQPSGLSQAQALMARAVAFLAVLALGGWVFGLVSNWAR